MQKNRIRISALLLAAVLVISMLPAASAASLTDIKGHWAADYITYGVTSGYISGYTDGTFRPNNTVTRAEFSKMVNTALGINHSASISFSDIKASDWYYNEVRKAVSAGYISGYADNTFGANRNITRQETAAMLARIVTEPEVASTTAFKDSATIDPWAGDAVAKMVSKTYMLGDKNNNFRPKAALTRAEAAKILYEVLKNEIIASTNQSFSVVGSSYYNTIYPNNVTVTEGVANGAISFNSCRILGTLTASGGLDSTVNLQNTGVNTLVTSAASGEAKIALSGSSYVTKTVVKNGVTLSGAGFDAVSLDGDNLSSDTVRLLGDFNSVTLSTSAVIKATGGTIKQFTVSDRATLMLQSATIDRFDLEAAAKDSSIALSDGVTIKTAYLKGSADFTGGGSIQTAYETGGTVTYENRPTSVVGGGNSNNDNDDENEDNNRYDEEVTADSLVPTFSPRNGASGISVDPTIRLTFDNTVYRSASNTQITTTYIEDSAVELREGSLSGYSVPFTATLNSNKNSITISPDEYLEPDTRYYIVLVAGKVYNEAGESNGRAYAAFTTEDNDDSGNYGEDNALIPTVNPIDGRTNVSRNNPDIRLSFGSTVYRTTGSTLSESYVQNNCVELREDSATGTPVQFKATLNSSKSIITIKPSSQLKEDTTYYIIIPRDTLSDRDNNTNPRFVSRFSTGNAVDGSDIQFNPENGEEDVAVDPEITISFDSPIYQYGGGAVTPRYLEENITLRRGNSSGSLVTFTADISSNKRTITILPDENLDTNTTYYIRIGNRALQYSTNKTIPQTTSYFRTSDGTLRVTDLSVGDTSSSTTDLYVTSNTTGTVTVKLSADGEATLTQTVAVTAGRQTAMSFAGLTPNTDYTAVATAKDGAGRTSEEKTLTFSTTTLSFELEATDVTKNGATIEATYSTIGTLAITYKKAGDHEAKTALSNFTPNKVGTKSVALRNLEEGTTYIVSATFTDASNNSTSRDITFTTDVTSTETALKSLTINGSDGSYKVDILPDQETYEVEIANIERITITPTAADDRATITVNNMTVKSGATSGYISVSSSSTAYYTTNVSVKVRSESGVTKTYTLKIRVAPSGK